MIVLWFVNLANLRSLELLWVVSAWMVLRTPILEMAPILSILDPILVSYVRRTDIKCDVLRVWFALNQNLTSYLLVGFEFFGFRLFANLFRRSLELDFGWFDSWTNLAGVTSKQVGVFWEIFFIYLLRSTLAVLTNLASGPRYLLEQDIDRLSGGQLCLVEFDSL